MCIVVYILRQQANPYASIHVHYAYALYTWNII